MDRVLVTISGKDKPGIIAKVTSLLFSRGCNLEDVSMTLLEGQFAMMLTACLPKRVSLDSVDRGLKLLSQSPWSMDYHIAPLKGGAKRGKKHAAHCRPYIITAFGKDRIGIVYEISRVLAGLRINITDLDSRILGQGAKTTYALILEVDVPAAADFTKIKAVLSRVSKKIKIEIQIKPIERVSL